MPYLHTTRLYMIPLTPELVQTAMRDVRELERRLACRIAPGWPSDLYQSVLPLKAAELSENPLAGRWGGWVIHRRRQILLGNMGLKAGPNETGTVSLGYSIAPAYRGHGYATEMGRAFVEWALRQPGVERVTADCLAANLASARVLEKIGLRRVREQGGTIYWAKERQ
ncbi:GNAT family N-acetyltransferase [Ectobacillus ponti]|uniref:GNAT family N-acetyltransferase n=1 Tax=Ectobacillus ponti TaxID=2961894 RepID=A0AA41X7C5_9BACI|nr:GNAT family N-acetyltransferase [Ectobacillus ponti]MCP8968538.1 GNAT family N-acetyltransferase [Ectobacillus ponti]